MVKIIMCTYNGEAYIWDQLESIKNNSIKDWELYISDDGSTDNTLDIVRSFKKEQSQNVLIYANRLAHGVALNFLNMLYGMKEHIGAGDYVMFCDQDDIWNSNKIEITLKEMDDLTKKCGSEIPLLVCSDVKVVNEKLELISESFHKMNHYNIRAMDLSHLMMENKVQGCTTMINKALVDMLIKLPKHPLMHDWWCAFIAAAFGKIAYIDQPTMLYRQHTKNISGSLNFWDDIRGKLWKLPQQKYIVLNTTEQIREFIDIYEDHGLEGDNLDKAIAFATLGKQGFLTRRYNIVKYHMWKSGILRNVGLMVLI